VKQLKKKKCKICKTEFIPFNSLTKVCSSQCAYEYVQQENLRKSRKDAKEQRKQHREDKNGLKSRSDWLREAQTVFNAYIRARDRGQPCISCDKSDNGQHQRHASHYRSVKACSILRFNTFNVHSSCATCNAILSGNLLEYRIRLIKKIGAERVDWLECQNNPIRYDIDYLKRLKKIFSKRAKRVLSRV